MKTSRNAHIYQVDAFAERTFSGNPAAVVPLSDWPSDEVLQSIAAENNLAETAFFVENENQYDLRWFTPRYEVDLCGHATLASGFVIFTEMSVGTHEVTFNTRSGPLSVTRQRDLLVMNFPALSCEPCPAPPELLLEALWTRPVEVLISGRKYVAIYESEQQVTEIRPNLGQLEDLHPMGTVITAPGNSADFVSRYFAPSFGIPEDPVTGSNHSVLVPFWSQRLGKSELLARQLSRRGGELYCRDLGRRVEIAGKAVLYMKGEIYY